MRPQSSMGFLEQLFTYSRIRKCYVVYSYWARIMAALTLKKTRGARIRSQFSSIYAHDEKKELRSDELDTLRRSRNLPVILTVNGRGAQTRKPKYTFIFLISSWQCKYSTKRLLFHRLELCEDHGYSCEWVSGQKTKGDQRGEDDFMQNGQLRTSCCSRNFLRVLGAIRRQHRHRRICLQQVQFKSEVAN